MYSFSSILCRGVVFLWRKVEYDRSMMSLRSSAGISDVGTKREMIWYDRSENESPRQEDSQSAGRVGSVSGM